MPSQPTHRDPSTPPTAVGDSSKLVRRNAPRSLAEAASPPTADDLYLFNEGTHYRLWRHLGAHPLGLATRFAVWAPNARRVAVTGSFNGWNRSATPLEPLGDSGIWQGTVDGVGPGTLYKYHVVSATRDFAADRSDPFAFHAETPPRTASIVWDMGYEWNDQRWMRERGPHNALDAPMSIYELHVGSWRRFGRGDRVPTYREIAEPLADYVTRMGFTHVEFMPLAEHPFYGSWGYQITGFFAASSRYGTPQDLKYLIDVLHQRGIGVLLDWVPSHFPTDGHGLGYFDGTHLYEHSDPREGFHPDWNSLIFNYGRHEVRSFLISNALFWLDEYHLDGLRVDAVASMLYRDYTRRAGEWIPNKFGGRENLEAIELLQRLDTEVYATFPDVQMIAEESTAWPGVSRPVEAGGLGFGLKWDMGWMHDTLRYLGREAVHRSHHHGELPFRMLYAFHENFVLPLSHDEVVHGKGSLLSRMPGDDWQKLANLRLLFAYQHAMPGKKLLFMGGELAEWREWDHDRELEWSLETVPAHAGVQRLVADLNRLHREHAALHELDFSPDGFEWVHADDHLQSVLSFLRRGTDDELVLAVLNFTPVPRHHYRLGVTVSGRWRELLNTDAEAYGGSGLGNLGGVEAELVPTHGRPYSVSLTLPPLSAVFLTPQQGTEP